MQTCSSQNKQSAGKMSKRWLAKRRFAIPVAAFLCAASFAQEGTSEVSSVSVEPPVSHTMTAAVCPVVGSGFYQLGAVFALSAPQNTGTREDTPAAQQGQAQHTTSASVEDTSAHTDAGAAVLTAQDMCALSQAGDLAEIERHTLLTSYSPKQLSASDALEELLVAVAQIHASSHTSLDATSTSVAGQARLLRFKVNGQDWMERCAALYVSPAAEGRAFLLSLDLASDTTSATDTVDTTDATDMTSTNGSEPLGGRGAVTVHLLFKPSGEFLHYTVAAKAVGDTGGDGSAPAVFDTSANLEAFRTGSIVSLKSATQGAQVDLLIDLGDEAN